MSCRRRWAYPSGPAQDPQLLPLHGDRRFDELDRAGRLNARERWVACWSEAESWIREGRFTDAERLLLDLIAAIERVDRTETGRWVAPRLALATCWIRQRRFDEAERLLLPTLTVVRAEASILAQCEIGRGRLDSALERIAASDSLLHPVLDIAAKLYATAQLQVLRGQDEDALRSLARASELGCDDADRLEHDLAFAKLRARAEFRTIVKSARLFVPGEDK